jgi:hypothetical protein
MKSNNEIIQEKVSQELKKKGLTAKEIVVYSSSIESKIEFTMLFEEELSMYKAWEMYTGSRKGYSENMKCFYVSV